MRLAPGGLRLVFALGVAGAIAAILITPLAAVPFWLIAVAIGAFYRDPDRTVPGSGAVAPADGTVRSIETTDDGRVRLAIFLNLWHVHVIRAPWTGTIATSRRIDGHRRPAFLARAADNAGVELELESGTLALQAGMLARRVRVYPDPGAAVDRGERVGHIAFGSRVTVTFPPGVDDEAVLVAEGERTRAGETRLLATAP